MEIVFSPQDQKSLARAKIQSLILFGSQAQNIAQNNSDIDVLVIGTQSNQNYDLVYELLSAQVAGFKDFDIVFGQDAPGELLMHVVKYGQVLYAENPQVFADFKQQTMLNYADFAYHRQLFQASTLARIATI